MKVAILVVLMAILSGCAAEKYIRRGVAKDMENSAYYRGKVDALSEALRPWAEITAESKKFILCEGESLIWNGLGWSKFTRVEEKP